jgi:hypothetical protein
MVNKTTNTKIYILLDVLVAAAVAMTGTADIYNVLNYFIKELVAKIPSLGRKKV